MPESHTVIPLSPIRKIIAARMTEAKRTIPHFRIVADIEMDALLALRKELREANPDADLSLNDLLIKACAAALLDAPAINIQWAENEIHQWCTADISIVTALKDGLSTPIICSAESKSVWEIAREVREFAARARKKALKMNEIFGGSFSISNLGMYGVDQFDAIINPPQCAILAIGRARPQCVISKDHESRIATVVRMTLSVDHRAIDGATAAVFLDALRLRVEQPEHLRPGKKGS